MRTGVRVAVGAVSGLSWGIGAAVLLQQFGLVPLHPAFFYSVVAGASVLSGLRAISRARRLRTSLLLSLLLISAAFGSSETQASVQVQTCESVPTVCDEGRDLNDANWWNPIRVDPSDRWIVLQLREQPEPNGGNWEVWLEFAGWHDPHTDTYGDDITTLKLALDLKPLEFYLLQEDDIPKADDRLELDNGWWEGLTNLTGIYHIGGKVDVEGEVGKPFDGYLRIGGNPFAFDNLIGIAALGLTGFGLVGAWVAGRPGPIRGRRGGGGSRQEQLKPDGEPVIVGDIVVSSPGLAGDLKVDRPPAGEAFGSTGWEQPLVDTFVEHHAQIDLVVEIGKARELADVQVEDLRTTRHGEPAIVVEVPGPKEGWGQFVVTTDESGVAGWCHPMTAADSGDGRRSYAVPRRVGPGGRSDAAPHLFGPLGSKLLNVIVFPLLDPVFGAVGERFARSWEAKKRPYRLRTFTPGDYNRPEADEPDWDQLASGKGLLMVHGTFSQAHTGFGGFSPEFVGDIAELYEGRVFAFDHYTLSDDPRRNIEWLFDHLPDGIELDLDVMCHSRGGLVSRVLAEKQTEIETGGRQVRVDKIIFAAAPNAGTILADPEYVGDLLDSYTNLMNFAVVPLVADAVITVVKHAAVGVLKGLDGLQAMRPEGQFLTWLNSPAANPSRYFAISGNFEPGNEGWKRYAADRLLDRIFKEANDLVVPTVSVYTENGSNHFPITNRLEFGESDGVHHSGYFGHSTARDKLLEWLGS